jgi:hypothetical protein
MALVAKASLLLFAVPGFWLRCGLIACGVLQTSFI